MHLLKNMLDASRRSLWIIPLIMTVFGLLLSMGLYQLDGFLWKREIPLLGVPWGVNPDGIRSLFSNISGAIITAMTTILSITLLIFTVLAGQYGAYILRGFKIRSFSKIVIGWFAGTYIYIIYNIYRVSTSPENDYIPQLSISFGVLFTLITIFLLIFYIHFLVRQIQAGTVISEIGTELRSSIRKLEKLDPAKTLAQDLAMPESIGWQRHLVEMDSYGYIQSIDKKEMAKIAEKNDCLIELLYRPGQFILTGTTTVVVFRNKKLSEKIIQEIRSCFITGDKRIPVEDLEYNLELLLEMTLRALSPGINDLKIAYNAIDYIGESIALLVTRQFPPTRRYSEKRELLMISKEFSFKGYMDAAFNPLRQYSIDHPAIVIRLLEILIEVYRIATWARYRSTIRYHFEAIQTMATEKYQGSIDFLSITERFDTFRSLLPSDAGGTATSEKVDD